MLPDAEKPILLKSSRHFRRFFVLFLHDFVNLMATICPSAEIKSTTLYVYNYILYGIILSARWIDHGASVVNLERAFRRGQDGDTSAEINPYAFSRTTWWNKCLIFQLNNRLFCLFGTIFVKMRDAFISDLLSLWHRYNVSYEKNAAVTSYKKKN